jgi:NADP-dependent 3-hydroxy acid dehydrogenase YdfG
VTGASYGVGAATAMALARDGFQLALTARREQNLACTAAALEGIGASVLRLELDLRMQDSIELAVAKMLEAFGAIDVLVNNAAENPHGKIVDVTREVWDNSRSI